MWILLIVGHAVNCLGASYNASIGISPPGFPWHQYAIQSGDTLTATNTSEKGPFASSYPYPYPTNPSWNELVISWMGSGSSMPGGGTLTFRLKIGSTVLWTSKAYTEDNTVWYTDAKIRCDSDGGSGSLTLSIKQGVGPGTGNFVGSSGFSGTVSGIDWSTASTLGLTCQWSVADAGHTAVQRSCDAFCFY